MSYKYMTEALEKGLEPVVKSEIVEVLKKVGLREGNVLIVHTSLRAFGYVVGGARTIYEAIIEVIGKEGTLIVPTQTLENMNPELWEYPPVPKEWIEKIKEHAPSYDEDLTLPRGMGEFSTFVKGLKDSKRSSHPLYSFAGVGKGAEEILKNHPLDDGFSTTSPLGRLYEKGAKILLLGTTFDSNTALHLAEYDLGREVIKESAKVDGVWCEFNNIDLDIYDDFLQIEEEFLKEETSYKMENLQEGRVLCLDFKRCVDFAKEYYKKKE